MGFFPGERAIRHDWEAVAGPLDPGGGVRVSPLGGRPLETNDRRDAGHPAAGRQRTRWMVIRGALEARGNEATPASSRFGWHRGGA